MISQRHLPARARGFTLLEVIVVAAIFSIFGLLAFGSLNRLIQQDDILRSSAERLQELQFAVRSMTSDLYQAQPRPVRDLLGEGRIGSMVSGVNSEFPLEFTRGGWSNTIGARRPTLQRVAYLIDDGSLVRVYWQVLDRTLASQPIRVALLDGVEQMTIRFMDSTRNWQTDWPLLAADGDPQAQLYARPLAVEFVLVLEDFGQIRRVVELSP